MTAYGLFTVQVDMRYAPLLRSHHSLRLLRHQGITLSDPRLRVVAEDGSAEANHLAFSPFSYLETSRSDQGFGSISTDATDNFGLKTPRNEVTQQNAQSLGADPVRRLEHSSTSR